ncbi:MAG: iron-containing alcohol dehydrogenase [Thermofilaceae archaeon]
MSVMIAAVHIPTKVYLGFGVSNLLGAELVAAGVKNALIIADEAVDANLLNALKTRVTSFNVLVSVQSLNFPEVTLDNIKELAKLMDRWEAVIAVGKGVTLDLVKSAAGRKASLITIPTPPGIENAITRSTLPPMGLRKMKTQNVYPYLALLDPNLAVRLDAFSVAASIIETLANSLEIFASRKTNLFSLTLAEAALREVASVKLSGERVEELEGLQAYTAALYAGLANDQVGGAALKALTHAFYALYGLPPYKTLATLLIPWLKRLHEVSSEQGSRVFHPSFTPSFTENLVEWIEKLLIEYNFVTTLRELGVKPKTLDLVVEYAWTYEYYLVLNDVTVADKYSLREILEAASGKSA